MDRCSNSGESRQRRKSQSEEKESEEKESEEIESEDRTSMSMCAKSYKQFRKVGSLKWWVRRLLVRWEMNDCTPLWREAHFEANMLKFGAVFGSWDVQKSACRCCEKMREAHFQVKMLKNLMFGAFLPVEMFKKVHAVVARCTFRSQNVKKHLSFGTLLEVEISKKCMRLWREANFEVNVLKARRIRTSFGRWAVEK